MRRGRITSNQITPNGVKALQFVKSKGEIWKYGLTKKEIPKDDSVDKQHSWYVSTANRAVDQLAEGSYTTRKNDDNGPHLRRNYVPTERGNLVAPRMMIASPGMRMPDSGANLGGGTIGVALSNIGFGMTSGAFFSCPVGYGGLSVAWVDGDPVVGIGARICPKCGKTSTDVSACDNCGHSFVGNS